ncbi:HAD family phosphatase [Candidatus Woesearchaeota archaeon]|nr:HAD family phosphatase [Candidatus Woesearchaeota archaeon]
MKHILFSDADGTLLHRVGGPDTSTADGISFVSNKALSLIESYRREDNLFGVITGRRAGSRWILNWLFSPDHLVMETGSAIYSERVLDREWLAHLSEEIGDPGAKKGVLWDLEKALKSDGYVTDSQGRIGSFRLGIGDSYDLSCEQKEAAASRVNQLSGDSITTVLNHDMLYVIPRKGGKANAMAYLVNKLGIGNDAVLVLCDDYNDLGMAAASCWAACPAHAPEAVKEVVRLKGYVSGFTLHEGTVDMLNQVVAKFVPAYEKL